VYTSLGKTLTHQGTVAQHGSNGASKSLDTHLCQHHTLGSHICFRRIDYKVVFLRERERERGREREREREHEREREKEREKERERERVCVCERERVTGTEREREREREREKERGGESKSV